MEWILKNLLRADITKETKSVYISFVRTFKKYTLINWYVHICEVPFAYSLIFSPIQLITVGVIKSDDNEQNENHKSIGSCKKLDLI